ncbi:hypothetical protein G7Y89_g13893 [Cudoniella acicularis]|uniref:Major facilitator superfamily (MFS) profile domain-containing protein n=1 Tax=Cudoniella acicularis TaxID=354080 RepID=A0A8H4VW02_9HELO|nr:hypothetical protein G7Y89_g13893 [Cudoniella acicularis]
MELETEPPQLDLASNRIQVLKIILLELPLSNDNSILHIVVLELHEESVLNILKHSFFKFGTHHQDLSGFDWGCYTNTSCGWQWLINDATTATGAPDPDAPLVTTHGDIIGQGGPSNDIFTQLWASIAAKYVSQPNVIFGIMNEPWEVNITLWAEILQEFVTAIFKLTFDFAVYLEYVGWAAGGRLHAAFKGFELELVEKRIDKCGKQGRLTAKEVCEYVIRGYQVWNCWNKAEKPPRALLPRIKPFCFAVRNAQHVSGSMSIEQRESRVWKMTPRRSRPYSRVHVTSTTATSSALSSHRLLQPWVIFTNKVKLAKMSEGIRRGTLQTTDDVNRIEAPVTWKAYLICAFASFGGIFFGYDSGYINGVNGSPEFYKLVEGATATELSSSHQSLIVSILSAGTFFGALIAGDVAERIGRKWTVIIGCLIYIIGVVIQMITGPEVNALGAIVAGRLIAGLGVGFESAIVIFVPRRFAELSLLDTNFASPSVSCWLLALSTALRTAQILHHTVSQLVFNSPGVSSSEVA